ncbi:MAG TPA: hypothetical protein VGM84_10315 [Steroidobacteraceae bacterium]|jgi:hypothetical protein
MIEQAYFKFIPSAMREKLAPRWVTQTTLFDHHLSQTHLGGKRRTPCAHSNFFAEVKFEVI